MVVHLPPGAGKTILIGYMFRLALIRNPQKMCIFVVPRTTLLIQTKKVFEEIFGFDVGIIRGSDELNLDRHVQVATIQSLTNRLNSSNSWVRDKFRDLPVTILAKDECHLQYKGLSVIKDAWNPYLLGASGSPFSKGMGLHWESLVRPKSMAELIDDGILVNYRVRACVPVNRANIKKSSTGEFIDKDLEDETNKIIGDICKEYIDSDEMRSRKVIGFAPTISTCIAISDEFCKSGIRSAYVHSKQSENDVEDILDAFRQGFYDIVWSVIKLCEGLDIPEVSGIIDATAQAPSKYDPNLPNSAARLVQKVSRGLRSHPGKEDCLIHCHAMNYLQFGPYELLENSYPSLDMGKKQEAKELSKEERKERVVRECPKCHMAVQVVPCPYCGATPKNPTQWVEAGDLEFRDGEMIDVKGVKKESKKKPQIGKVEFASQLKSYCDQIRAKNPHANVKGMFAHKYKAYFGVWPRGEAHFDRVGMSEITPGFRSWITSQNIAYANRRKSA